jgi:hypothetical protein
MKEDWEMKPSIFFAIDIVITFHFASPQPAAERFRSYRVIRPFFARLPGRKPRRANAPADSPPVAMVA